MDDEPLGQNFYEVLQVHPAAPLELITGAYWWLINREQAARSAGYATEVALHHLTRAYQTLADPTLRRSHDVSLGLPPPAPFPVVPQRLREPPRRRGLIARRAADPEPGDVSVDYYEVLRVHPQAEPPILALARAVVGNYYLRQVRFGEASAGLLELLEEAYAVLSDPDGRPPKGGAAKEGQGDPGMEPPDGTVPRAVEQAPPGRRFITAPVRRRGEALARFTVTARGVAEAIAARGFARPNGTGREEEAAIVDRLSRLRDAASVQAPAAVAPSTAPALARLVVTGGPQTGKEFALNGIPLTIGAAERCDVVLTGAAARQAWIWASDGHFVVLNLPAEPAMLIGGRPLVQATLQDGDLLTFGPHRIRFDLTE